MSISEVNSTEVNSTEANSTWHPTIERIRLEPVRRTLTVKEVLALTPRMIRVTLTGEELAGFRSPSPDDHIKVFFAQPDNAPAGRDYTPRWFDPDKRELWVDFVLHDGGLASSWAAQAKPGDTLQIGGPRGSGVISAPGAWWLLIGDETAIPSIGRRLSELPSGTPVTTLIGVTGREEEQRFETRCALESTWVHRSEAQSADPAPLLAALSKITLSPGPGFVWIAAEAEVSRAARAHVVDILGHPADWTKASAYWTR